jgi:hypothetical protein
MLINCLESHPSYSTYEHLLSPGWIPGRKVVSISCMSAVLHDADGHIE